MDLLDWKDVLANKSVKNILHNNSGLCFLMEPWLVGTEEPNPDYYFGHSNGLSFLTPKTFMSPNIEPLEERRVLDPLCAESEIEISNPDPFEGFDCRCRPWY